MFSDLRCALRQLRHAPGFTIVAAAALAAWLPARRATRIDPIKALRTE